MVLNRPLLICRQGFRPDGSFWKAALVLGELVQPLLDDYMGVGLELEAVVRSGVMEVVGVVMMEVKFWGVEAVIFPPQFFQIFLILHCLLILAVAKLLFPFVISINLSFNFYLDLLNNLVKHLLMLSFSLSLEISVNTFSQLLRLFHSSSFLIRNVFAESPFFIPLLKVLKPLKNSLVWKSKILALVFVLRIAKEIYYLWLFNHIFFLQSLFVEVFQFLETSKCVGVSLKIDQKFDRMLGNWPQFLIKC